MNRSEWRQIYRKVARMYHVTPREVKREIRATIKEMYATPQTAQVRAVQEQILRKGQLPTPEEVISYLADQIREEEPVSTDDKSQFE